MNWSSNQQIRELLFTQLKLPVIVKTPKREPSTSKKALQALQGKHPIIPLILKHRKLSKLITTYTESLLTKVHPLTGKLHPEFKHIGTETVRLSCEAPNLQQIPKHSDEAKIIRKSFYADPGRLLVSFDFSQIELRVLAHIAKDVNLMNAFNTGKDIHQAVADSLGWADEEGRSRAKAVSFGIVYGSTEFGLAKTLKTTPDVAKKYITNYFNQYKSVYYWSKQQKYKARQEGKVAIAFGKERILPGFKSRDNFVQMTAERQALNTPIQGLAAYIMKIAMLKVFRYIEDNKLNIKPILQIHDDLVLDVPESMKDSQEIVNIKNIMETAVKLSVPIVANKKIGQNLGEL